LLWVPARPVAGEFEVLAADVGQGSAVLIRTASGSVLYDAGPQWSLHADAGQRVLRPLLQALGERPSHVVLSHRDADHVGGALGVLQGLPQAQVWASLPPSQLVSRLSAPELVAEVMGEWAAAPTDIPFAPTVGDPAGGSGAQPWPTQLGGRRWTRCEAGQQWEMDGVRFRVLHPGVHHYGRKTDSNNLSCVLWVQGRQASALLTGDLDAAHEAELVQAHPDLRADWLLAPHHGSKTSSSPALLAQVQPRWVVVQAGYRNRYGHPAAEVVRRYHDMGVQWVGTPDCGAARWDSARPDETACTRQARQRYWHARPTRIAPP
ncbi:MAG TPA: ComEC/Rec2 family competence protein, partial [Burkholderiaceae bacterium]|nr:ComEC/Rec2 family competence protein [Burkholderiaceae bacterium]